MGSLAFARLPLAGYSIGYFAFAKVSYRKIMKRREVATWWHRRLVKYPDGFPCLFLHPGGLEGAFLVLFYHTLPYSYVNLLFGVVMMTEWSLVYVRDTSLFLDARKTLRARTLV